MIYFNCDRGDFFRIQDSFVCPNGDVVLQLKYDFQGEFEVDSDFMEYACVLPTKYNNIIKLLYQ